MATRQLAVLWDLDGTLIDSEPLLFEAERQMLVGYGIDLTAEIKSQFVGLGGTEVLQAIADHFEVVPDLPAWTRGKVEAYLQLLDSVPACEPTVELARRLGGTGVPQAVASGSPVWIIERALKAIGLDEVITTHVSVDQVAAGKPAPDVFLHAAGVLGVAPSDCVVVEDAVPGMQAGKAAGMRVLAIPYITDPLDPAFEQADYLVPGGMAAADPDAMFAWMTHQ
nr:HAD family phosphatase [Propionicimonas sp.]